MGRPWAVAVAVETHYLCVILLLSSVTRFFELAFPELNYGACCTEIQQIIYLSSKTVGCTALALTYFVFFNFAKLEVRLSPLMIHLVDVIIFCPAVIIQVAIISSWKNKTGLVDAILAFLIQLGCTIGLFLMIRILIFVVAGVSYLPKEEFMQKDAEESTLSFSADPDDIQITVSDVRKPSGNGVGGNVLLRPFQSEERLSSSTSQQQSFGQMNPMMKYSTTGGISGRQSNGKSARNSGGDREVPAPINTKLKGKPPVPPLGGGLSPIKPSSPVGGNSRLVKSKTSKSEASHSSCGFSRSNTAPSNRAFSGDSSRISGSRGRDSGSNMRSSGKSAKSSHSTSSQSTVHIPFTFLETEEFDHLLEHRYAVSNVHGFNDHAPGIQMGDWVTMELETFYWDAPRSEAVMLSSESRKSVHVDTHGKAELSSEFLTALVGLTEGTSCTIVVAPQSESTVAVGHARPDPEFCYLIYNLEIESIQQSEE